MRKQKFINNIKKFATSYYVNIPKSLMLIKGWDNTTKIMVKDDPINNAIIIKKFDMFEEAKSDKDRKS